MTVPRYDPLLDDLKDDSIREDSVAPVGKVDGYLSVVADILYYFTGGHRYKIQATLDDPASSFLLLETGDFILLETGDKIILE